jgi:hypothetical protein
MADKQKVLQESVEKLRRLNVADDEIVAYLKEFGIPEDYIRSLLSGTVPVSAPEPQKKRVPAAEEEQIEAPVIGDISARFFRKKSDERKTPDGVPARVSQRQAASEPLPKQGPKRVPAEPSDASGQMASLWEKGILSTVTDSLIEMKKIRDDLDAVLAKRLDAALDKESQKITALQESLRQLMMAKMNSELEKKSAEFSAMLDERITELKRTKDEFKKEEDLMRTERKVASELYRQLSEELSKSKELRDKSVAQFNADLLKSRSDVLVLIEDSRKKMLAIEERATKTLQLETAIIEGMVKDAAGRIDRLTVDKIEELAQGVQARLDEFEQMKAGVDLAQLRNDVADLRERVNDLELKKGK